MAQKKQVTGEYQPHEKQTLEDLVAKHGKVKAIELGAKQLNRSESGVRQQIYKPRKLALTDVINTDAAEKLKEINEEKGTKFSAQRKSGPKTTAPAKRSYNRQPVKNQKNTAAVATVEIDQLIKSSSVLNSVRFLLTRLKPEEKKELVQEMDFSDEEKVELVKVLFTEK